MFAACSGEGEGNDDDTVISGVTSASTTQSTSATETGDATDGVTSDSASTSASDATNTTDASSATDATDSSTATTSTTGTTDTGAMDEPPRDSLMLEFLADAQMRAADIDAGLELTQINAFGIDDTGRVGIDGDTGFVRRWNFGFTNPNDNHQVAIIYMSESWTGDYPQIEDPAGNITTTEPSVSINSLPDSDAIVAAYAGQSACLPLTGNESDNFLIRYDADRGGDVLQFTVAGGSWGVDFPSYGAWYDC